MSDAFDWRNEYERGIGVPPGFVLVPVRPSTTMLVYMNAISAERAIRSWESILINRRVPTDEERNVRSKQGRHSKA